MIMDNTETIINLSLLSFAGLAFVALLVSLELMKDETRRKLLESLRAAKTSRAAKNESHASGT